jgi:transcription elongation factor GreA
MLSHKPVLLTREGLQRITEELELLKTTRREEVAVRLMNAMQDGQDDDFIDNAELEAARNEQSFLEGRINEIENILRNYQIIDVAGAAAGDVVVVGTFVTVVEIGDDEAEEERYHLVGAAEADPTAGRISNESPLGRALLGAKPGQVVRVNAPRGVVQFRIVGIG